MMSFASLGEEASRPAPATVPPPLPPKTRRPVSATAVATGPGVGGATTVPASSPPAVGGEHVVKIRINPEGGSVRISVGPPEPEEMVQRNEDAFLKQPERGGNPYFFCSGFPSSGMVMSSGQSSPSDTLDSGTCSDLDGSTPPPLPKKNGAASTVTVTVNGSGGGGHAHHRRTASLSSGAEPYSDEDAHSTISCDSLNGHELNGGMDELGKLALSNGHGHHHNHKHGATNGESIMESIQEEKLIPPPSAPLKSVALTVQANNLVNGTSSPKPLPPKTLAKPSSKPFVVSATMVQAVTAPAPPAPPVAPKPSPNTPTGPKTFLPQGLLQDIRDRSANLSNGGPASARKARSWDKAATPPPTSPEPKEYPKNQSSLYRMLQQPRASSPEEPGPAKSGGIVQERTYEERARERSAATPEPGATPAGTRSRAGSYKYEEDRYYQFHLREHEPDPEAEAARRPRPEEDDDEETFAGVKDLLGSKQASATIRSAKGTVRGVRNRVRAGIATFLHYPDTKNYKEKEAGKVVLYVTTMGIVRHTFQECLKVKKILRTLLVKYEERDAFMSREVQTELRERMHSDQVLVPQLFIEGQHIGDAETIERLNETGELRKMLKPFKSPDVCNTCQVCGGFRLLPCSICNGSKKSMHRNDFTAEFVALKCMSCDEVGLVKCYAC